MHSAKAYQPKVYKEPNQPQTLQNRVLFDLDESNFFMEKDFT